MTAFDLGSDTRQAGHPIFGLITHAGLHLCRRGIFVVFQGHGRGDRLLGRGSFRGGFHSYDVLVVLYLQKKKPVIFTLR